MAKTSQDPTFDVNDYDLLKILSPTETYVKNILVLLFGKPGFMPSLPTLGMNISQYLYKFEDEINTDTIKSELARQCSEYLPDIQTGDIDVFKRLMNGRLVLIFKLPVIIDDKNIEVALGITTNDKGELVYQYKENDINQII
jgi:hypothetical protein